MGGEGHTQAQRAGCTYQAGRGSSLPHGARIRHTAAPQPEMDTGTAKDWHTRVRKWECILSLSLFSLSPPTLTWKADIYSSIQERHAMQEEGTHDAAPGCAIPVLYRLP